MGDLVVAAPFRAVQGSGGEPVLHVHAGAVGQQHLAIGHRVGPGAAADPEAAADKATATPRGEAKERLFYGYCHGRLAASPQGTSGFGYDPVFLPDADGARTMAELSDAEKDEISHRGRAARSLARWLGR